MDVGCSAATAGMAADGAERASRVPGDGAPDPDASVPPRDSNPGKAPCAADAAPWRCPSCRRHPLPVEQVVVGVDYAFPWDRLIADFKFRDRVDLAAPLADLIVAALGAGPSLPSPAVLVPVPLSPPRLAERGYNQAARLARALAARLSLPMDERSLSRPIDRQHQADLGRRERLRNLRDSFLVEPRQRDALAGQHVLLVDDVMTTGATLMAAAGELRRAGAATVQALVVARTP